MDGFEELQVWKRSSRLAVRIYDIFRDLKDYGFKDQVQRAAVSIASNIAEGFEYNLTKKYIFHLRVAKGSSAELRTQIYIAKEIGYIDEKIMKNIITELKEISSMLQGLINSLQQSL